MFGFQLSDMDNGHVQWSNTKKPDVENSRLRPLNFNYTYLILDITYQRNSNGYKHTNVSGSNNQMRRVVMLYGYTGWNRRWKIDLWTSNSYISACTQVRQQQNSNGCTYVFGVRLSNMDSGHVLRSNRKWTIQESGFLTFISHITACTLDNNDIPTAKQMFRGQNIKWG